jgi:hypothetical protein
VVSEKDVEARCDKRLEKQRNVVVKETSMVRIVPVWHLKCIGTVENPKDWSRIPCEFEKNCDTAGEAERAAVDHVEYGEYAKHEVLITQATRVRSE